VAAGGATSGAAGVSTTAGGAAAGGVSATGGAAGVSTTGTAAGGAAAGGFATGLAIARETKRAKATGNDFEYNMLAEKTGKIHNNVDPKNKAGNVSSS